MLSTMKLTSLLLLSIAAAFAQDLTITNVRIIGPNATVIERGSIVVRGGKIASVAAGAPAATVGRVIDAKGVHAPLGTIWAAAEADDRGAGDLCELRCQRAH